MIAFSEEEAFERHVLICYPYDREQDFHRISSHAMGLVACAPQGGFEIMVEIEGRFVTFTPPTDAAYLMGDFTDWDDESLPIAGPVTIEFPPEA